MVYVNVQRGGPGIGAIQPAQQDYLQATKASGNGGFRMIVLAPDSVQECVDMVYEAYDLAERDQNPVLVLTDGVMGTMMEPVVLPPMKTDEELAACRAKFADRAIVGHPLGQQAFCRPGSVGDGQEKVNIDAAAMYETWDKDIRVEEYMMDDAEICIAAFGIASRVSRNAIDEARRQGIKVGMIRPITLWPFPKAPFEKAVDKAKSFISVELSMGQMIEDIKLATECKKPVYLCNRAGGIIPSPEEVLAAIVKANENGGDL